MITSIDPFNQLKMEYNSIRALIDTYTNYGPIVAYMGGLKEAIDKADKESVLYYLNRIIHWYDSNIKEIENDEDYIESTRKEHSETLKMLKDINEKLQEYDFAQIKSIDITEEKGKGDKKIFLSHKSSDKKYGDALERLLMGLGVKENQLIYTSHPLHKIPLGQRIYEYLRANINAQVFMIILWSNDYLESPACLSEMGAAWVMQTDYVGIYTPGFSFGNPKYHEVPIDTTKMGALLNGDANCKASMIEFKNKIQTFFGLTDNENKSSYLIDEFMESIK